jgi:hypothetical protein
MTKPSAIGLGLYTSDAPVLTVHEAWAQILAELPAIPRTRRNEQQGFLFRGIDDVLDQLNPLLGKYGVHVVPVRQVAEREDRPTARGTVLHTVHLTVDWRVYGRQGDFFEAQTMGEGTDSGDKATSKAQTMAFKYLLWPSLAVAENETTDADATSPEATVADTEAQPPLRRRVREAPAPAAAEPELSSEAAPVDRAALLSTLSEALNELPSEHKAACRQELRRKFGSLAQMGPADLQTALQLVKGWGA